MSEFRTSANDPKTLADHGCAKDPSQQSDGFENLYGQKIGKLADLYGVDYPSKLTVTRGSDNFFAFEDASRVTLECDELTFLTDCTRIKLKGDDLSRYIDKTKRIVINGVSFVKEDEFGDGE